MNVGGIPYRSIFLARDGWGVSVVDQTTLPHRFRVATLHTVEEAADAISRMVVRGAPLIGVTAAYGLALAVRVDPSDAAMARAAELLVSTRPTAVNLRWAVERTVETLSAIDPEERAVAAYSLAAEMAEEDVALNRAIAEHGVALIREMAGRRAGEPVRVLTHCNAGWLATVDWGTALAPVYLAHGEGISVQVWVDETRPRNQGASLTAWELGQHGVPHTVVADNAGGHLMQRGEVDLCMVGTDRTTATGDVANKIGTYLKALAAHDNGVPFYVAAPSPSIDWTLERGEAIPIEERDGTEVSEISGMDADGRTVSVRVVPKDSPVANPAFDVTPARLVTGLITERGVAEASREGLAALFPERAVAGRGAGR